MSIWCWLAPAPYQQDKARGRGVQRGLVLAAERRGSSTGRKRVTRAPSATSATSDQRRGARLCGASWGRDLSAMKRRRGPGPRRGGSGRGRFPEHPALAGPGVHGGRTVSPPLGILCAEPGRGVPRDSLRAWRSTPTPPAVEAAERPAVGSGGCSEEEGLGRGCRRRGPEGGALPEAWTLRASRPRARSRRARRRAVGALRSYARRVFGESEASARRRSGGVGCSSAAAAGRAGARESIFTTADVRSMCRPLRRPGPRSG